MIEWRPWLHLYKVRVHPGSDAWCQPMATWFFTLCDPPPPPHACEQDKGLMDAESRKVRRESMQTSYIEAGVVDEIPAATAEPEPGMSHDDMNVIDALVEPPLADVVSAADVSLFDPSMRPVLAGLRKKAIGLEIILSLFAFVLLLITYGNSMRPSDYYANVNVAVINGDVGSNTAIGAVFQQVQSVFQPPYGFTVSYLDPAAFSLSQAQNLVDSGAYWAVWYINPGASAALAAALAAGSKTPNTPAITFIYDNGRGVSFLMGLLKVRVGCMDPSFASFIP